MSRRLAAALLLAGAVVAGCTGSGAGSASSPGSPSVVPADAMLERLRVALLGEPPFPSGWEEQVDDLIANIEARMEELQVPDTSGMDPARAACALWLPLVGNTDWATGAFLERQFFIAHLAAMSAKPPDEIRDAVDGALSISTAAAAEQVRPGGDSAIISRRPGDEIRAIGLWAVDNCDIPVVADEAPNTEGWTDDDVAQSCAFDRQFLADAQERFRDGPGEGHYAEHPHVLEVTVGAVMPAWHRSSVDNTVDPPTLDIEPIPGSFCDR